MPKRYGDQVLVNLLGSKKGEHMLSLNYQVGIYYMTGSGEREGMGIFCVERGLQLMKERYGDQVLVNLLGSKEGEHMLSLNYQVDDHFITYVCVCWVWD